MGSAYDARMWGQLQFYGYAVLFYAYAFLGAPAMARSLERVVHHDERHMGVGVHLALVMAVEIPALVLKTDGVMGRQKENPGTSSWTALFLCVFVAHYTVNIMLGMTVLQALGFSQKPQPSNGVMATVFFAVMIKEFFLLFVVGRRTVCPRFCSPKKEVAADVILLLFKCVAYTAYWDVILGVGPLDESRLWAVLLMFLPFTLAFLIIYLPTRFMWILEELYVKPPAGRRRRILQEIAIATLLAFAPLLSSALER